MAQYQEIAEESVGHLVAAKERVRQEVQQTISAGNQTILNLREYAEDMNAALKKFGIIDIKVSAEDWKKEGNDLVGVLQVSRGTEASKEIRISRPPHGTAVLVSGETVSVRDVKERISAHAT
jgi:hypothetical protein